MSTTSQTMGVMPAAASRATAARGEHKSGFFATLLDRFVKAREAEASRRVAQFLANQSDDRLTDLGFSSRDIAEIRSTGRIPAGYFK